LTLAKLGRALKRAPARSKKLDRFKRSSLKALSVVGTSALTFDTTLTVSHGTYDALSERLDPFDSAQGRPQRGGYNVQIKVAFGTNALQSCNRVMR
jgi:hypothetical protein